MGHAGHKGTQPNKGIKVNKGTKFSRDVRALRATNNESMFVNSLADPLQLPWVRNKARRCHGGKCSCGHSEAAEGQSYSFGGGWRLIEALVIALSMRVLHHTPPTASPATSSALFCCVYEKCVHVQACTASVICGLQA